jgi:hypothetical protein
MGRPQRGQAMSLKKRPRNLWVSHSTPPGQALTDPSPEFLKPDRVAFTHSAGRVNVGSVTVNVLPCPGSDSTSMRPPWASTIRCEM